MPRASSSVLRSTRSAVPEAEAHPRRSELHLGNAVFEPVLARAAHHYRVARIQGEPALWAAAFGTHTEAARPTERDDGNQWVQAHAAVAIGVPSDAVAAVAIEVDEAG